MCNKLNNLKDNKDIRPLILVKNTIDLIGHAHTSYVSHPPIFMHILIYHIKKKKRKHQDANKFLTCAQKTLRGYIFYPIGKCA